MIDVTTTDQIVPGEVDDTVDLEKVGVLSGAELERDVFVCGDTTDAPVLRPGERCAVLGDRTVLMYGHLPAVRAAATAIEYAGGDPDPDLGKVAEAVVAPSVWALFTRHRLDCAAGGDPAACGCAPADDPDGFYVSGASEGVPGAVLVTPVILPEGADRG